MDIWELLPGILIVLYYLFRGDKNKKKKRPSQPVDQQEQRSSTLEEILRNLENVGKPEKAETVQETPKTEPDDRPLYQREKIKGQSKKTDLADIEVKSVEKLETPEDIEETKSVFSLREAVIQQAILQRPWEYLPHLGRPIISDREN